MSPIEETVATLRRSHLALVVCGIVLLAMSLPSSAIHEPAIEEVQAVRSLLEGGGVDAICAREAESRFDDYWEGIVDQAQRQSGRAVVLADDFVATFTAHCPHPSAIRRLSDIRGFLEAGLWVDFPTPTDSVLVGMLVRSAGLGRLETADVRWTTPVVDTLTGRVFLAPITDTHLQSINLGEDSIEVELTVGASMPDTFDSLPPIAAAADTTDADTTATDADTDSVSIPSRASVSAALPGTVFQELLPPEDFLGRDERWEILVGEALPDLPIPVLPALREYWYEVERLSPADAELHLEALSARRATSAGLLGVRVDVESLGLAAAVLLVVVLLHLLLHANRLAGAPATDEVQLQPWPPLYAGTLATVTAWISLVCLPIAVLTVLTWRVLPLATGTGLVLLAATLSCLALGLGVLRAIGAIRNPTSA